MGMFSTKTRIKVQSTVLNLAGDIGNRPNFLKTIIFDQTYHKLKPSYAAAITDSYLGGQGIKLRRVVPYAKRVDYTSLTGQNKARISTAGSLDIDQLTSVLSFRLQKDVAISDAAIDAPIIYWWADQWILANHPSLANSDYDAEFNEDTDNIDITFEVTGHKFSFLPTNFDVNGEYLYVTYRTNNDTTVGDPLTIYGEPEEVTDLPDMTDWVYVSETTVDSVFSWVERTNISLDYVDGRFEKLDELAVQKESIKETTNRYYKKELTIIGGKIDYDSYHDITYKLVPTKTENKITFPEYVQTTVVTSFELVPVLTTTTNATNTTVTGKGPTEIFIYLRGDGDGELDAIFENSIDGGDYFPFVPVKTDLKPGKKANQVFIDNDTMPDMYKANVSMMRKVSGKNTYDTMLDKLKESEGSRDINYAYVMFGVSINTPDTSAMVYLFKFFRALMGTGAGDPAYVSFEAAWTRAEASVKKWNDWYLAQSDPDSDMFGLVEPGILPYPTAPTKTVSLRSNNKFALDYRISWNGTKLVKGTGRATPKIKTHYGDMAKGKKSGLKETTWLGAQIVNINIAGFNPAGDEIIIYYQIDEDNWEAIHVYGLTSLNMIYRGKGVYKTARDELDNKDESGLIIPLNDSVFRNMPLVAATQMTTGCMYMVINTYQTWDKKYWQTDWFKVIIIVIIVALTVFSGGTAASLSGTIGGMAATTIGLTGIAAMIFAVVVNAIAGMIISRILTAAATAVFGEKIGIIVGAIASMVAMNAMNSFAAGQQFNIMDAFNGDNLIKLTSTIASDFGKLYAQETTKLIADTQTMMAEYKVKSEEYKNAYNEEFGNRALLDPLKFLDSSEQLYFENSSTFLTRTLMTGSDISGLSMDAIGMLTEIGTSVNLE